MSNYFALNPTILNEARNYLDGLLLGDGHIPHSGGIDNTTYQQSCKHKNWLDVISKDLYEYGIESRVDNGRLRTGGFNAKGGSINYRLWTHSYVEFREMRNRWYVKWYDIENFSESRWHEDTECRGDWYVWRKIVPEDIFLSPVCVANWYLGDGTIRQINGYQLAISTEDFIREDIIFLVDLLSEVLDINCGIQKSGKICIYNKKDIGMFLNYIKDYNIDCYSHKFPNNLIDELYFPQSEQTIESRQIRLPYLR